MRLLYKHLNLFSTAITSPPPSHKYLALIAQLKDPLYFRYLLQEEERIRGMNSGQYCNFRAVRAHINQLLHLGRLIRWGQAYHTTNEECGGRRRIQELIQLAFSERVSLTHQNIEQEERSDFQTIHFYLYFQLTPNRTPSISMLYLNYMQILRHRCPIQLSRAHESLLQGRIGQNQKLILQRGSIWLKQIGINIRRKIEQINKGNIMNQQSKMKYLNQIEMSLIIGHYKRLINLLDSSQLQEVVDIFDHYLQQDQMKGDAMNSYLHLENIVFILYLYMNNLNAIDKSLSFMAIIFSRTFCPISLYILELFPHQDKLTCLKVDLWLSILKDGPHPLKQTACTVINQLYSLSLVTWRYKYLVWLFDSVASANIFGYQLLEHIQIVINTHKLDEHQLLDSYLIAFRRITDFNRNGQIPSHVVTMETANALWLCGQQDSELLSQPHAVLCEMLPHADGHPFLQQLYLPFLSRLLELSLGNFSWPLLTQLYYFGLRWKAPVTEQGHWRMQYVRRYIMSQYSSMGIRRRQIPQSSYFYKIHEQTTPDTFYSSFENQ